MSRLSYASLESYVRSQLCRICPRFGTDPRLPAQGIQGHWKDDWGLDSLELMELAGFFHGQFQLFNGPVTGYLLQYDRVEEWVYQLELAVQNPDLPFLFHTSGSTGQPKPCFHSKASVWQELAFLQETFAPLSRCWSLVPDHHIYGFLFSVALPDQLGASRADARSLPLPALLSQIQAGDLVIGHPLWWKQWAQLGISWPAGWRGVNSTGPLDAETKAYFRQQPGTLWEVYGSTETGGIALRTQQQEHFQLFPHWRREAAGLARWLPENENWQPNPIMDQLSWKGESSFVLTGRTDQAVQVGGINVFPMQIAQRLAVLPGVQQAWVRLMQPQEGQRLKAWIQPEDGVGEAHLRSQLLAWIERELSVPERPRHLTFSPLPPVNELGKAQDWRMEHLPG
jgi:4-coumarate--CoA ligase (photoactive yellow protein activation family)